MSVLNDKELSGRDEDEGDDLYPLDEQHADTRAAFCGLALIGGTLLLCIALGWQLGMGIGLLTFFLKVPEYRPC